MTTFTWLLILATVVIVGHIAGWLGVLALGPTLLAAAPLVRVVVGDGDTR